MRHAANGDAVVSHREFISNISFPKQGFDLQYQLGINPANSAMFPWLARIAIQYEIYEFRELRFIFEPQASTQTQGSVMMAIDYDAADSAPSNPQTMLAYNDYTSNPPWVAGILRCRPKDLSRSKTFYTLAGAQPAGTDIKTYDTGNFYLATETAGTVPFAAGQLFVEYVVRLSSPQTENTILSGSVYSPLSASNGIFGDINTINDRIHGPLPMIIKGVVSADQVLSFYIGVAGYYQVMLQSTEGVTGNELTLDWDFVAQQNGNTDYHFYSNGTDQMITVLYGQVVNTAARAFSVSAEGPWSGKITQLSVIPVDPLIVPNLTFTGPIYAQLTNNRRRLGRVVESF